MLLQKQPDGGEKPVTYRSRPLKKAEYAYYKTHMECLAVVLAVPLLRLYIEGFWVAIRTSLDTPRWISNMMDLTENLVRRRLRLSESDFELVDDVKHQAVSSLYHLQTAGIV